MPLGKIHLRPGITVELTPTANEGGFSVSQLIRFFAGQVQKYGGWVRLAGIAALKGQCRGLFGWADLLGTPHLAAGTDQQLAVITSGILYDITPIVATTNAAPMLTTFAASITVTVTDATHSPAVGDWINLVTQVAIGHVVVSGFAQVSVVTDGTHYNVTFPNIPLSPPGRNPHPLPLTVADGPGGVVPTYTTTVGSATVTVAMPFHRLTVGAAYYVTVSTVVAGLTLFGFYNVATVVDANTFTIAGPGLAGASTTVAENGGNMRIQYPLGSGSPATFSAGGWGTGDWGGGPWGMAATSGGALLVKARTWSLDHFGQNLIASPDQGAIYTWSPSGAVLPASVISSTAPITNRVVFSVAQVQMVLAAGSESGGTFFPTLIRWCNSGDFTDWTPTATNQAGSFQLPSGSFVSAAMAVGLGALIWTDEDLWSVTYQGLPFVFGFNQIGVSCEALSKKAPAAIGNAVIWPSSRGFFRYAGGGIAPVECPVWDFLFDNLDVVQQDQVCAGVNSLFNEVAWFFPVTAGTPDPNTGVPVGAGVVWYVKLNYLENTWDYGQLIRTAWCDHSPFGNPVGTDQNGLIYQHETSPDADGLPIVSFAQSGYYDLQDGNEMEYVNVVIPDFIASSGSTIDVTILATDYPGEAPRSYGPFAITPTTKRINVSLRARQVAFRIGSSDLGSSWRMGAVRYGPATGTGKRP